MQSNRFDQFFSQLPTKPSHYRKILVTGASGCVGGLLIPVLLERGYQVRVMVRSRPEKYQELWPEAEVAVADVLQLSDLQRALEGIECAFYLIHSLPLGKKQYPRIDRQAAINFREAAAINNLKRIIYLANLGDPNDTLSTHLSSRQDVGYQLQQGKTPVTILRSAVIIGAQSTSYKIILFLVRNCPIFIIPSWGNTLCQPIALRSVILYLVGSLENEETTGGSFDIGGNSVLSFASMLKIQAASLGKKRVFMPSRISLVSLYARIASLVAPVRFNVIKALMESCVNEVICQEDRIRSLIPIDLLTYEKALAKASSFQSDPQATSPAKDSFPSQGPPSKSKWTLSDLRHFILHKPDHATLIKFNSKADRENYTYRILQRLGTGVEKYKILNVHKIGVNAPAKYVFEELLEWDADSTCWPNNIARITKVHDRLEHLNIHLFGWTKYPSWLRPFFGTQTTPLFRLDAIEIRNLPDELSSDNARYLLYKCSGGYPIGVFTMYVRSSIREQGEKEQSQLFLMVGFNFYGRDSRSKWNPVHKIWELVHDRVTTNVLNRIKQLSEWRFSKIQKGRVQAPNL